MGELGERLRAAREAKELTIDQVAEESRIQRAYLEALESESFGSFSSELHARGFLRNYASYLGSRPEEMLALYDKTQGKILHRAKKAPRLQPAHLRSLAPAQAKHSAIDAPSVAHLPSRDAAALRRSSAICCCC